MNALEIDNIVHKSEETEVLVFNLSLDSELVPNHPASFRSRDFGILEDRQSNYFYCRLYVARKRLRIRPHKK